MSETILASHDDQQSPLPPLARVAILCADRQIDTSVPATVPLRVVMDDLVAILATEHRLNVQLDPGHAWTLARLGADPLDRHTTLDEAKVVDGDLLVLRAVRGNEKFLRVVEEVSEAVAVRTQEFAEFTADTARVCGLAGIVAAAAGGGYVGVSAWRISAWPWWIPALLAFLGAGLWLFAILDDRRAQPIGVNALQYAAGIASWFLLGAAGLTAVPAAGYPRELAAANWLLAGVVVAVSAIGLGALTRGGVAASTAATVIGTLTAAASAVGVAASGARVSAIAAGIVLIALLGLASAPKLTAALARLRPPDLPAPGEKMREETLEESYQPEAPAEALSADDVLERRTRNGNKYLTGLVIGFTVCLTVAAVLTANGSGGPHALAGALTAVLVTIELFFLARSYVDRVQSLVMYAGAGLILIGSSAVIVGSQSSALVQALAIGWFAVAASVGVLAALRGPGSKLTPPARKRIERLNYAVIAITYPVTLWATGLYGMLKGL